MTINSIFATFNLSLVAGGTTKLRLICLALEASHALNCRTPPAYNCFIHYHWPLCCIEN